MWANISELQQKIQNPLHDFTILFPCEKLKPKHHFMLYYANNIKNFSPLRSTWYIRFEAKDYLFDRLARSCNYFKNLTQMLDETSAAAGLLSSR